MRGVASVVLIVLACGSAAVGGIALYAREEIVNTDAFVDRAADALGQPITQAVVGREIAVQILEPALPDALAARPLVQSAVKIAVASEPFRAVFRLAVRHGHRLLFDQGSNGVFDIADAGTVIASALRTLAPKVARQIPKDTDAILLTIRKRSFAGTTLRVADHVRVLGIVLPFAALALFVAAIAVSPLRRLAITRGAAGLGTSAIFVALLLELVRRYVMAHVVPGTGLNRGDVRGAVGEIWGAYFDDLETWALGLAAGAYLLAAASSSVLAPYSAPVILRRAREFVVGTHSPRARAIKGALALVIGVFAVVKPTLAFRMLAVGGGALLVYIGFGELLSVTAPETRAVRGRWRIKSTGRALALAGTGAAVLGAVIVAFVLTGVTPGQAQSGRTCEGYAQLCARRLDEVALAGTHNSMSAADAPGWFIANQDRPIQAQLQDGIRAFKISTHYGTLGQTGMVHTDILAEGDRLNRVAQKLIPAARAALQRLSHGLGKLGNDVGKRDIWLCHTLCELGATRMVTFFQTIRRFLETNPNQVIELFDEDYVEERDLESAFKQAGVFRYLAHLESGQPLPTLGALISQHRNIVVFAQEKVSGKYPWNRYAFASWIQDTPLGAQKPNQFTCQLYRGTADNPLLMMNNWADIFPPRPTPNVPLVRQKFILRRAQQCVQQRGRLPNLILTDFYNRGDVVGAVNVLNGVQGQKPAPLKPFGAE